ncbi:hypothetical protein Tco_0281964 [Tanacetum coccineum]
MKAITTRSGVAYEGPSIPTNPSSKKVVERETEETTDKEQTNFHEVYAHHPPSLIPFPIPEPYAPELLGFSNKSSGGNPTPTSEPLTSEFILEEIEAYLKDDSISPEIDHADCDPEEDICLIEKLLNNDPFQLPSMDLSKGEKFKAITFDGGKKEEPPGIRVKRFPSHLEYA